MQKESCGHLATIVKFIIDVHPQIALPEQTCGYYHTILVGVLSTILSGILSGSFFTRWEPYRKPYPKSGRLPCLVPKALHNTPTKPVVTRLSGLLCTSLKGDPGSLDTVCKNLAIHFEFCKNFRSHRLWPRLTFFGLAAHTSKSGTCQEINVRLMP